MTIQFDGTTNQATVGDLVANSVQVGGVSVNLYPLVSGNTLTYNWNGLTTNTVLDFTGIPATAKRITVMFSGLSTGGTSGILIQLGTSGGIDALTYTSKSTRLTGTTSTASYTIGFGIGIGNTAATLDGQIPIVNISANTWVASGVLSDFGSGNHGFTVGGSKTLAGILDRVRITSISGTETFNAGSVNIMWE